MSEKPFKKLDLKNKPRLKLVNTSSSSPSCLHCGKARNNGSLTSWILQSNYCHCQAPVDLKQSQQTDLQHVFPTEDILW